MVIPPTLVNTGTSSVSLTGASGTALATSSSGQATGSPAATGTTSASSLASAVK